MTIDLDALEREVNEYPDDATCNREIIELIQRLREAELDAERYRWLRHGDNDEDVLRDYGSGNTDVYLLRGELLDAAIDQQRKIATGEDLGRPVNADTPRDYMQPEWHVHNRVHGWRNYISDELQTLWPTFTSEQRAALARNAEELAGREHWD